MIIDYDTVFCGHGIDAKVGDIVHKNDAMIGGHFCYNDRWAAMVQDARRKKLLPVDFKVPEDYKGESILGACMYMSKKFIDGLVGKGYLNSPYSCLRVRFPDDIMFALLAYNLGGAIVEGGSLADIGDIACLQWSFVVPIAEAIAQGKGMYHPVKGCDGISKADYARERDNRNEFRLLRGRKPLGAKYESVSCGEGNYSKVIGRITDCGGFAHTP
jgi:hypothetical protein